MVSDVLIERFCCEVLRVSADDFLLSALVREIDVVCYDLFQGVFVEESFKEGEECVKSASCFFFPGVFSPPCVVVFIWGEECSVF